MAGFDIEKARAYYGIPADCETVAAIAMGYPGGSQPIANGAEGA
jgi:hypothetical protein